MLYAQLKQKILDLSNGFQINIFLRIIYKVYVILVNNYIRNIISKIHHIKMIHIPVKYFLVQGIEI